jgi:hypothetical protein
MKKQIVAVRALKTRIFNPETKSTETYSRGHIFKKPWSELIAMAKADKKHNVLALVEETEEVKSDDK